MSKEKGERRKEQGARSKEKGERRKEKGERNKVKELYVKWMMCDSKGQRAKSEERREKGIRPLTSDFRLPTFDF